MDAILRASAIYVVLFVLFRIFGKRTLADVTTFDLVVLLVVGEATQQALLGEDFSITQAALVIATLIMIDRIWDFFSWRFPAFRNLAESPPLVLIRDGKLDRTAMRSAQVSEEEILQSARKNQGLESLEDIKHVVLESSGRLSVIPKN